MTQFIAIEIGGTKLQLARGRGAYIEDRRQIAVRRDLGAKGIRAHIAENLATLLTPEVEAVGIGFGGPVDWRTGEIRCSHHVEGWSNFPLGAWVKEQTGLPVFVDNDANVASLGEACHGAGAGRNPVFYVTMGSGVGGGLTVDGRIYHGATPGESEIGHVRLDKSGRIVESSCSGWGVDRKLRQAARDEPNGALAQLIGPTEGGEAKFLGKALRQNDPQATLILRETAEDMAFALSHVTHLFHPEAIILGGGLSLLGETLREAVASALPQFIMDAFRPGPDVLLARLSEDAVPVGALELARRRLAG
jgi:glucokinase